MGKKLVVVELFSGIGGFGLGIEEAFKESLGKPHKGEHKTESSGCNDCVDAGQLGEHTGDYDGIRFWANDIDPYACAIYRYRFGDNPSGVKDERSGRERAGGEGGHGIQLSDRGSDGCDDNTGEEATSACAIYEGDLQAIDPADIPTPDILTFGWPCQDNSYSGKRAGQREGTRSGLLFEAVRILRSKKPKYFIAENVPGLFSVNDGYDFYEALRLFADAGYDVQWQVLDTRWFLPQNRKRIIFVGHLIGQRRPKIFPIGEATEGDYEPLQACEPEGN